MGNQMSTLVIELLLRADAERPLFDAIFVKHEQIGLPPVLHREATLRVMTFQNSARHMPWERAVHWRATDPKI
jgi:hypothetical protein